MAYTSVIPVHRLDNSVNYALDKKKTTRQKYKPESGAASLEDAVNYALNRDKTELDVFESAIGCTCETAFLDMKKTKEHWHKTGGVQGYHLVQSFAEGEIKSELAHRVGLELAAQLLLGGFETVCATHLNAKCLHNHIVWNSVSHIDGKKYHSNEKSYYTQVRRISDEQCQKYGLSIIKTEPHRNISMSYSEWIAEQNGQPTWRTAIRQDIDDVLMVSLSWKQLVKELQKKGYEWKLGRKYISLRPPGKERFVRLKTLGAGYSETALRERILSPKPQRVPAGKKKVKKAAPRKGRFIQTRPLRLSGLRALYYSYLYRMGVLRRKPPRPGYALREDIRRLDQRIEQMRFLSAHKIDSREQLVIIRNDHEADIAEIIKERQRLYRNDQDSPQIAILTGKLKELRRTVKMCRNIEQQSVELEQRMQAAQMEVLRQQLKKQQKNKGKNNPTKEERE